MPLDEKRQVRFVALLGGTDFSRRYYEFYDQGRNRTLIEARDYNHEAVVQVMTAIRPNCRYFKSERFFRYTDSCDGHVFYLNVASLHHSLVELIFFDKTYAIGGVYSGLAKEVGELADPNFRHQPGYPMLKFGNLEQMREAVVFGLSLYEEMKAAILSCSDWDTEGAMCKSGSR